MFERIRECAGQLKPELARFTERLLAIADPASGREDAGPFIERHMSYELDYDLVFQDPAGNIVGVLVGAEDGMAVLLRSSIADDSRWIEAPAEFDSLSGITRKNSISWPSHAAGMCGFASQLYAGQILAASGMLLRGTIVVSCSCAGRSGTGRDTRILLENTLPGLGIDPDLAVLAEPTSLIPMGKTGRWAQKALESAGLERTGASSPAAAPSGRSCQNIILEDEYNIPLIRFGAGIIGRNGHIVFPAGIDELVEAAFGNAIIAHRFTGDWQNHPLSGGPS